ncbi:hypothetical protein [Arthrobacter sp. GMC3]|uniref:hypothetical protein n=1 Tax=Arthrobacter sp. GMC3 TaxID=2058894 RepID=UPI000CE44A34|nr:hypothetical protein [Arthrobacter sp. GMC3]
MENINATITKKIEYEKARLNVPWGTLAENAGMSLTNFNRKRVGGKDWSATEVARLADFLRVPFAEFFPSELVEARA